MKVSHSRLIGVAAAAALGTACFAAQSQSQSDSRRQGQQQQSADQQSNQKAPEGFVLVRESVITLTANEPQNHFIRAQELLTHGDLRAAAAETRIGAAYLDMQASRDQHAGAGELESAADNLRKIARELQQQAGEQNSSQGSQSHQQGQSQASGQQSQPGQHSDKQLTEAFARANHALAAHFQSMAQQELQGHKRFKAGYDLDAAASALRASCVWSGQQPSPEVATAVSDAHRAADQLISPRSGKRQSGQQSQSNANQKSNDDQAEPAAARFSGSDQEQSAQESSSQSGQDTQRADRAVQELGKAIQAEKVPGESSQDSGAAADHHSSASHGSSSVKNSSSSENKGK